MFSEAARWITYFVRLNWKPKNVKCQISLNFELRGNGEPSAPNPPSSGPNQETERKTPEAAPYGPPFHWKRRFPFVDYF